MIHIGQPAPEWSNALAYHKGQEFHRLNLRDFRGLWLVFFFYPRDFTFICPTELKAFAEIENELGKLGAKVVACSTDSEWTHKAWFERDLSMVTYPVLADTTHAISRAYDVYNEADGLAERGLFIIDPESLVRYALISAGSVGRSAKETIRVIKALQTGERCPIDWMPGQTTLGKA